MGNFVQAILYRQPGPELPWSWVSLRKKSQVPLMPCSEKHCGNWTALALVSEMGNFRGALKAKAKETLESSHFGAPSAREPLWRQGLIGRRSGFAELS
jgi:hypothetical protein